MVDGLPFLHVFFFSSGLFLVVAFINQDYDHRSLLPLSGDIKSNLGLPRTRCGTGIRAGASFLSCAGRCGGLSHKQLPWSDTLLHTCDTWPQS